MFWTLTSLNILNKDIFKFLNTDSSVWIIVGHDDYGEGDDGKIDLRDEGTLYIMMSHQPQTQTFSSHTATPQ